MKIRFIISAQDGRTTSRYQPPRLVLYDPSPAMRKYEAGQYMLHTR